MASETLAEKTARRDRYVAAETAILGGAQQYSVDGMTFIRADITKVQNAIIRLNSEISLLEAQSTGNKSPFNKATFGRPT